MLWVRHRPLVLGAGAFMAHHPPVISIASHSRLSVPAAVWSSSPTVILLVTFMVHCPSVVAVIFHGGLSTHTTVWSFLPAVILLVGSLTSLVPVIVSVNIEGTLWKDATTLPDCRGFLGVDYGVTHRKAS